MHIPIHTDDYTMRHLVAQVDVQEDAWNAIRETARMTKIQKIAKRVKKNKNRKVKQMLLGQARREISQLSLSIELKRSAYRQILRLSGHESESHIELLANEEIL